MKRLQGRPATKDWRLPIQRHCYHEAAEEEEALPRKEPMVGPVTGPARTRAKDMTPNLPEEFPLEALLQLAKMLRDSCIDSKVAEVDDAAAAAATVKVDRLVLVQEKRLETALGISPKRKRLDSARELAFELDS